MFTPVQFGKYFLTERIAVGGMAEIFKAKLRGVSGFEKSMVVKQILPQYAQDTAFINMFIDEAKIAVSLNHGNIVTVYELGRIDGIYFIAMEYIRGKNLAEIIEVARSRRLPLSIEHAMFIAIEICKGLDYAHRRTDEQGNLLGVVHRDISPANVLVSMTGEVKITDLGIAKARHKLGNTDTGAVKGTYGYMSPEQINGDSVDYRTDIFSTGILLHEMLTGLRLFPHPTDIAAMERARQARIPPASQLNPAVSPELDAALARALALHVDDRYHDANEFQLALSRLLFSSEGGATSTSLASYVRELFPGEGARYAATGELIQASRALAAAADSLSKGVSPALVPGPGNGMNRGTQSYAVRSEFAELAASIPEAQGRDQRTLALSSLFGDAAAASPEAGSSSSLPDSLNATIGGQQPASPGIPGPQRPHVPQLRVTPESHADAWSRSERGDALRRALTPPSAAEREQGWSQQGDSIGARQAAARAAAITRPGGSADLAEPANAVERAALRVRQMAGAASPQVDPQRGRRTSPTPGAVPGPRSDESVMALLVHPPSESHPTIDASEGTPGRSTAPGFDVLAEHPEQSDLRHADMPAFYNTGQPPNLLSSTMRLFVQGLGPDRGQIDDPDLDVVPRTIKPTALGWIVIVVVALSALLFVLSRKTSVFKGERADEPALLGVEQIKPSGSADAPADAVGKQRLGTISIAAKPNTALVFLHEGDTPVTIDGLDLGHSHVIRVEREGYRTAHRIVTPEDIRKHQPISVTLSPIGSGGGSVPLPTEVPDMTVSGELGRLSVRSDPPSASIWRLVGTGTVRLVDIPMKRHYFKVVAPGYQQAFLSISRAQLEQSNGPVVETVSLEKDGSAAASASAERTRRPNVSSSGSEPSRASTTDERSRARKAATRTQRTHRRTHHHRRTTSTRPRHRREPSRRQPSPPKPRGGGIQLPNWAN